MRRAPEGRSEGPKRSGARSSPTRTPMGIWRRGRDKVYGDDRLSVRGTPKDCAQPYTVGEKSRMLRLKSLSPLKSQAEDLLCQWSMERARGVGHAVPLVSNYLVQAFHDICQLLGRHLADSLANTIRRKGANLAYLDPGLL